MTGNSLTQSDSVQLSRGEWSDLQDCEMAFHACIERCGGLSGDEAAELLKGVFQRFSRSMAAIGQRLEQDGSQRPSIP